jgi:hypothetical protein
VPSPCSKLRLALWVLLTLALCGLGPVQDGAPPSERERIAAAMKVLKSRDVDADQRELAMADLLFLGLDGPRALGAWLERELKERRKASAKQEQRLLAFFGARAQKLVVERLDRKAEIAIAEARAVVRKNAADGALSKDTIKNESDPAVERLTELLTIRVPRVWDDVEQLRGEWEALLDATDREFVLIEYWESAQAALRSAPGGGDRQAASLEEPERPARNSEALLDELDRLAQLAIPMSQMSRRVFEENAALPVATGEVPGEGEIGAEEKLGVRFLNLRRVLLGKSAQRIDLRLCNACRGHSKDMEEHDFFSHTSPLKGKESPWARAALEGTSAGAENIARGADTGEGAILQWWYSPGHHRNMLGGGSRTGLGQHHAHWTQLFGG